MIRYSIIAGILFFVVACTSQNESTTEAKEIDLKGSWEIVAQIDHDGGKTEWEDFGAGLIYQKHLTPTHFTWVAFDPAADALVGAGGGSYSLEGNVYVENIEFFYPMGTGYVGQSITFDAELDGDTWYHKGVAPLVEFDPESGDMVVFDTTNIEEKWVRIKGTTEYENMLKTWNLVNYKTDPEGTYDSYPDFVGYMKLLTPTNFVWIRYNGMENGGEVVGLGSGSWSMDESNYIEHINIMYPDGMKAVSTDAPFQYTHEDNKWYHFGFVVQETDGVVTDSLMIDEVWVSEE